MADTTTAVILNPRAAGGATLKMLPRIHGILKRIGEPYAIHVTQERGDATTAAKDFAGKGATRVLAVGGDGTINEVANGLFQARTTAALGVIPVGHGNDFARTIGVGKSVEQAVLRACERDSAPIDLGLAKWDTGEERAFINVAGLGFDALVAARTQHSKLPGSNLPYLTSALTTLIGFNNIDVHVVADGEVVDTPGVFVSVANAQYMGGGYYFAPMASLDDGLLDLCIVGDFGKFELVRAIPSVYKGKHVTHPKFTHIAAKEIRVESKQPASVQLDGEVLGQAPVTFSVQPGAIYLVK